MKPWALALLLSAAPPSGAAVVEGAARLDAPLPGSWSGAALAPAAIPDFAPALTASPAFLSAPTLGAAPLAAVSLAAPALAAPAVLPAAAAPAAPPSVPARIAAALPAAPAAQAGPQRPSGEQAAFEASRAFDGFGAARRSNETPVPAADAAAAGPAADGFSRGSFASASPGLTVAYKFRPGPAGAAPRVYSGGLALNESFDPLFARSAAPKRPEYFLWTRGHAPTGWVPTEAPIDGDARDLARMILIASRDSGSPKVELALHSFGTLVFQRMVQLRDEPEVGEALKRLSGSRVTLLNATTHYEGSEHRAGRQFEQMGQATRGFVDWLNQMDAIAATWEKEAGQKEFAGEVFRKSLADWRATTAAAWESAARLNPYYARALGAWLALWQQTAAAVDKAADPNEFAAKTIRLMLNQWREQRGQLLKMASNGASTMMKADLQEPWAPEVDPIRRGFTSALAADSQDRGWQESLLRRSSDMFRLEFTNEDVQAIRRMKIRLDLIHATGDQLLNWASAQTLFELLGIPAPDQMPEPGTVLTDPTGRFRAFIVAGDHYYPLKQREDLAARLDP